MTIFFALNKSQKHLLTSATRLVELPNFLPFLSVETLDYQHQELESKLKLNLVKTKSTEKVETLMRLIAGFNQEVCLIFCNHKPQLECLQKYKKVGRVMSQHQKQKLLNQQFSLKQYLKSIK